MISAGFNLKENQRAWIRQYSSRGAFEQVDGKYSNAMGFLSSHVPVLSPGNASVDPEGGTNLFSVSLVPDGTPVKNIPTPVPAVTDSGVRGCSWDGRYVWTGDQTSDTIYRLRTDGTVQSKFASPTNQPTGLSWDGTYLWHSETLSEHIYKLKTDGTPLTSFSCCTGVRPLDVAWDGSYLWIVCHDIATVYKHKTDGTRVDTISTGRYEIDCLTWDGVYLTYLEGQYNNAYRMKTDGTEVGSFKLPGPDFVGLGWTGTYLLGVDKNANVIYWVGSSKGIGSIAYKLTEIS